MESSPDWSSIVHSPPFTFLVGPSHTKLTIQSGLARHVSKPLDHLMNSGLTRESKHHIAVLEEEDVETFVAFTEYAYTGDYNVPPPGFREDEKLDEVAEPEFRGMFSNPFASAVPPPAPSPPESVKHFAKDAEVSKDEGPNPDQEEQPQIETKGEEEAVKQEVKQENDSAGDEHATPDEPPQDPEPAVDQSSEQPPATPAAEEGDPWSLAEEAAPSKGKKGKKNKKDKKKQKGAAPAEEPTVNLTPPNTPPPENPKDGINSDPALEPETSAVVEEPLQVTEPTETTAVEEAVEVPKPAEDDNALETVTPSLEAEPWAPTEPITPVMEDAPPAEMPQEDEIRQEQKIREEVVFPRSQMNPFIDTSFAKQHFPLRRPTGMGLWDEFAAIDYVDHRSMYGTRPLTPVSARSGSNKTDLPYLVFHAKVYVFAVRYLIPALAQLCLRKLHTDLLNLSFPDPKVDDHQDPEQIALTTSKARIVLDLLHYTYTKTTRLEPISPTAATQLRDNELRKLVVHYAACKVRDLAEYSPPMESLLSSPLASPVDKRPRRAGRPSSRGFRTLLDSTTELASDLVYRMM